MKITHWILVTLTAGSTAIAEDAKPNNERQQRPERPIQKALLKEFDKDGDGKISPAERSKMRRFLRERRKIHRDAMLARFDADGDGVINAEERKFGHDTILREMLVKYDENGNGELDRDERRTMVEGEGHNPLRFFASTRSQKGERRTHPEKKTERRERGPQGENDSRPGKSSP